MTAYTMLFEKEKEKTEKAPFGAFPVNIYLQFLEKDSCFTVRWG
jgi:hypothetical protein